MKVGTRVDVPFDDDVRGGVVLVHSPETHHVFVVFTDVSWTFAPQSLEGGWYPDYWVVDCG